MADDTQDKSQIDGACPGDLLPYKFFITSSALALLAVAIAAMPASALTRDGEFGAAAAAAHSAAVGASTVSMNAAADFMPLSRNRQGATDVAGADAGLVRVALENSGLKVENAAGAAGEEIPLNIKIGEYDAEKYSFLMIRGLPAEFALSAGFRLKDRWAVSLRVLSNLSLTPPEGYSGTLKLEVMLVRGQDKPVEHQDMMVLVGKGGKRTAAVSPLPDTQPTVARQTESTDATAALNPGSAPSVAPDEAPKRVKAAPTAKTRAISPEEESSMLQRASTILDEGDVASARLLLEHIARKGSGKGALALAQTYDPAFLRSINTLGLRPNPEKAREWYQIAADLGEDTARERLSALSGR
jgi:hypothetical protein